jgi:hypothetical protein
VIEAPSSGAMRNEDHSETARGDSTRRHHRDRWEKTSGLK